MKKASIISVIAIIFGLSVKSQSSIVEFDSLKFNKDLELATWLYEYEFHTQMAVDKFSRQMENVGGDWFSYDQDNIWHTICGKQVENKFIIFKNIMSDSADNVVDYTGDFDLERVNSCGIAISKAEIYFQLVRDTANIYFNSFVRYNPDQTISVWFFPALQPSGQAVYGCEWEYVFNKNASDLLQQKFFINRISGVWIGKPRELWLNYRTADFTPLGGLFFVVSFCDYFTRIRIDTRLSTSTISKDIDGNYSWKHSLK
ncbi:MAG: hypothetical protein ACOYN4_03140 [Bacteroidales bacterium]